MTGDDWYYYKNPPKPWIEKRPKPIRPIDVVKQKQEEINRAVDNCILEINRRLKAGIMIYEVPLQITHLQPIVVDILISKYKQEGWKVKLVAAGKVVSHSNIPKDTLYFSE